jgi:hypothetical protein
MNRVKTIALDKESHIRNDAPPRAVANSDKEISSLRQAAKAESSNPALTPTANTTLNPTITGNAPRVRTKTTEHEREH